MRDLHPDQTRQDYEPPAIVRLGSVDQVTLDAPDGSSVSLTTTTEP